MNIRNRAAVGVAALVAAALCASVAQASDGTITFTGQVTASTCTINGGGAGSSFTVPLPTVSSTSFAAAGDTAGRADFSIVLSACTPTSGNVYASFETGPTVDGGTRRLNNMSVAATPATRVQVELLNGDGTFIAVGQPVATQNSLPATISGGAATLSYAARYYANGGIPTAGPLTTSVVYSLIYN